MKHKQKFYAIVKTGKLKYFGEVRLPLIEAQAPIFSKKRVAEGYMDQYNTGGGLEIKEVNLILASPLE
jgi:hypothetical protein